MSHSESCPLFLRAVATTTSAVLVSQEYEGRWYQRAPYAAVPLELLSGHGACGWGQGDTVQCAALCFVFVMCSILKIHSALHGSAKMLRMYTHTHTKNLHPALPHTFISRGYCTDLTVIIPDRSVVTDPADTHGVCLCPICPPLYKKTLFLVDPGYLRRFK